METIKADNRRIVKNTVFLYIRMIFILVVTLYTSRVVFKYLGVVDFGINNVVAGFVSLFAFLNTSLTGAIQRFYNYEGGIRGERGILDVYATSFFIQLVLALLVLLLTETVGLWYLHSVMVIPEDRFHAAEILYHFSIITMILVIMEIPYTSIILSLEKMDFYAYVSIFDVSVKLALVLLLPKMPGDRLVLFASMNLIVTIVDFLMYFIYAKKKLHLMSIQIRFFNKPLFKSMLSFSGWNLFGTFANIAHVQGYNLLLNYFFGPAVNAARGISSQISGALRGFSSNIVVSFRPQLVDSYAKGNYERTKSILFLETKSSYLMVLLLIVPLIIEMNQVLNLWLGDGVPKYAAVFSSLVLVNMLVTSCNAPFTQIIHAVGNLKVFQLLTSLLTILNLPIAYLLLRLGHQPTIIFVISIIIGIISQVVCALVVNHFFEYGITHYVKTVISPCILVTLLAPIPPLVVFYYMNSSFIRLLVVITVSLISTLSLSYLLAFDKYEKRKVKQTINKLIKGFNSFLIKQQ